VNWKPEQKGEPAGGREGGGTKCRIGKGARREELQTKNGYASCTVHLTHLSISSSVGMSY
jgi:hypothetical protein